MTFTKYIIANQNRRQRHWVNKYYCKEQKKGETNRNMV